MFYLPRTWGRILPFLSEVSSLSMEEPQCTNNSPSSWRSPPLLIRSFILKLATTVPKPIVIQFLLPSKGGKSKRGWVAELD